MANISIKLYEYEETEGVGAIFSTTGEFLVESNLNRREEGNKWLQDAVKLMNEKARVDNLSPALLVGRIVTYTD